MTAVVMAVLQQADGLAGDDVLAFVGGGADRLVGGA
ncbi:hypothetical protein SAZ_30395 [Streptomyces noursei ZPM]|nr:hypothetical protein SAZ_30395 [Streptomyces noursei ZPM]EPY93404.1 hypothetical protein K530_48285 [Streptomyces noursei CCRC 11814]